MKICSKCSNEKGLQEFSKCAKSKTGLRSECRACNAAYNAINREKQAAYHAAYRAENRDKISAYAAAYYSENREKSAAASIAWRAANPGRQAELHADWRAGNPDKIAAYNAANRAARPELYAEHRRNRRARKRNAEGSHTAFDVISIFAAQRGLCANCHGKLFKSGKKKFHVDHIMPLVLGGSNWPENLQCLCPTCNLRKSDKDPITWASEQGRLI